MSHHMETSKSITDPIFRTHREDSMPQDPEREAAELCKWTALACTFWAGSK